MAGWWNDEIGRRWRFRRDDRELRRRARRVASKRAQAEAKYHRAGNVAPTYLRVDEKRHLDAIEEQRRKIRSDYRRRQARYWLVPYPKPLGRIERSFTPETLTELEKQIRLARWAVWRPWVKGLAGVAGLAGFLASLATIWTALSRSGASPTSTSHSAITMSSTSTTSIEPTTSSEIVSTTSSTAPAATPSGSTVE